MNRDLTRLTVMAHKTADLKKIHLIRIKKVRYQYRKAKMKISTETQMTTVRL